MVYLDDATSPGGVASTIVDATSLVDGSAEPTLRILRDGAVPTERIREVADGTVVRGFGE
jgi:L-threonylcarbamoyladenylate synthase